MLSNEERMTIAKSEHILGYRKWQCEIPFIKF